MQNNVEQKKREGGHSKRLSSNNSKGVKFSSNRAGWVTGDEFGRLSGFACIDYDLLYLLRDDRELECEAADRVGR